MIEFALVLPLLLMFLVGTVYFGYVYVLQVAATHAAQQGTIAAVRVSPVGFDSKSAYQSQVRAVVADTVLQSLSWLPGSIRDGATSGMALCTGSSNESLGCQASFSGSLLKVTVTIDVAGGSSPLLPQIRLPPFGPIPPEDLTQVTGVAKVAL